MLRTQAPTVPLALACPTCRAALDGGRCGGCDVTYTCDSGLWRCLPPHRAAAYEQFQHEYLTVRRAEGWGSRDASYYRALPFSDLSGRFSNVWRIRATGFGVLLRELTGLSNLRVVDLGAGNCWLSYQLAQRGHTVAAVDVQVDEIDGLGAARHYDAEFVALQAEFDHLPLADAQADLAIFNGSLHYSTDYVATLREALRVLRPRGTIAILDSPMYGSEVSGLAMVSERQARFERSYGFTSDALPSLHFLTRARVEAAGNELGIRWRVVTPFPGWRRALLPLWARMRGGREPASFPVILGSQR
jgi:SAM-dependent methyltransferase